MVAEFYTTQQIGEMRGTVTVIDRLSEGLGIPIDTLCSICDIAPIEYLEMRRAIFDQDEELAPFRIF